MSEPIIDSSALDELNRAETRSLFDTADKLSSLGVGRIVDLPQIIVVGDQSAGKSSVLEAISHVRFPTQSNVCTRFATELVLRQGSQRRITATVNFADGKKPAHALKVTDFQQDDIDEIIHDAKNKMGISETGRDFSKDVLRLEISGPGLYPLTLVDLPGIFHAATARQSAEGRSMVMELLQSYMEKPNSIILAIVAANNQLANQVVMQMAAKYDPAKQRTLGVITKPDLHQSQISDEDEYMQVIRGREAIHKLKLGWHVVRNRGHGDVDEASRDELEEQFFRSGIWASVPMTNRGIRSLRIKLSRVLLEHVTTSLPKVLADIQQQLSEREEEHSRLGPPRSSTKDMMTYLIDISTGFQKLANDGIRGNYTDPFFGGLDSAHRKFRARLRNRNRAFHYVLLTYGEAQTIKERPGPEHLYGPPPAYLESLVSSYTQTLDKPQRVPWSKMSARLERQAAVNQGTEFPGFPNMDVVMQLFQKQSKPWERIAKLHLGIVIAIAKEFVEGVFEHLVGPLSAHDASRQQLLCRIDRFFEEKEQVLLAKLVELLKPYQEGYALPLDADFHELLDQRVADRMESQETEDDSSDESASDQGTTEKSSQFGTERIVDMMQTFYEMTLQTFANNLINLGIESCLVQDMSNILTPRDVGAMSQESLIELAAESNDTSEYRSQLAADIKLLRDGLEACRRYKPRSTQASQTMMLKSKAETNAREGVQRHSRASEDQVTTLPKRAQVPDPIPSVLPASKERQSVQKTPLFSTNSTLFPSVASSGSASSASSSPFSTSVSSLFSTPVRGDGDDKSRNIFGSHAMDTSATSTTKAASGAQSAFGMASASGQRASPFASSRFSDSK